MTLASIVVLAGTSAACSDDGSSSPEVPTPLPPRFTTQQLTTGLPVPIDGEGIDAATLWWFDDHPGTAGNWSLMPGEQDVPRPIPTEVGDVAVGLRNGAFCFFVPTIIAVRNGDRVDVDVVGADDEIDDLTRRDVHCSDAEEGVVIVFDLPADVTGLAVEGVDVPMD